MKYLVLILVTIFITSCNPVSNQTLLNQISDLKTTNSNLVSKTNLLINQNYSLVHQVDTLSKQINYLDSLKTDLTNTNWLLIAARNRLNTLLFKYQFKVNLLQVENDSLNAALLRGDSTFYAVAKQVNNAIVNNIKVILQRISEFDTTLIIK